MSDLNKDQIIKDYERQKNQEKKINDLTESVNKLNETIQGLLGGKGSKDPTEPKKDPEKSSKKKVPVKVEGDKKKEEDDKEKKEEPKKSKGILESFLGF